MLNFYLSSIFNANGNTQIQTAPLFTSPNVIYAFIPTSDELARPLLFCTTPLFIDLKPLGIIYYLLSLLADNRCLEFDKQKYLYYL